MQLAMQLAMRHDMRHAVRHAMRAFFIFNNPKIIFFLFRLNKMSLLKWKEMAEKKIENRSRC